MFPVYFILRVHWECLRVFTTASTRGIISTSGRNAASMSGTPIALPVLPVYIRGICSICSNDPPPQEGEVQAASVLLQYRTPKYCEHELYEQYEQYRALIYCQYEQYLKYCEGTYYTNPNRII